MDAGQTRGHERKVIDADLAAAIGRQGCTTQSRGCQVSVRVFTERAGRRSVVSHRAKQTRGLVARCLLEAHRSCRTFSDIAAVVGEHRSCKLTGAGRAGFG